MLKANAGAMKHMTSGADCGNQWVYRTKHPPEMIDAEGYWQPISHHVDETDEIKVFALRPDGGFFRATFVVLHAEPKCVICERETDWRLFSLDIQGVELVDRSTDREIYDVIETRTGRTLKKGVDRVTASALARAYRSEQSLPAVEPEINEEPRELNRSEMQSELKRITGKGMPPGTSTEDIAAALAAAKEKEAA